MKGGTFTIKKDFGHCCYWVGQLKLTQGQTINIQNSTIWPSEPARSLLEGDMFPLCLCICVQRNSSGSARNL